MGDLEEQARVFFARASKSREGEFTVSAFKSRVQFSLNGEQAFWARSVGKLFKIEAGKAPKAELTFDTDETTYRAIFKGGLTPTDAWFNGKLKLSNFAQEKIPYATLFTLIRVCQGKYFWHETSPTAGGPIVPYAFLEK